MGIHIICAIDSYGAIGYKNQLLYKIRHDLKAFKSRTCENAFTDKNYILMGSKTFESLPKPLGDNRINVILTRNKDYKVDEEYLKQYDIMIEHDLHKIMNHYIESGEQTREMYIIGGAETYAQTIQYADRIILTIVHDKAPDADTYFPLQELINFKGVKAERFKDEDSGLEYSFVEYVRKGDVNE